MDEWLKDDLPLLECGGSWTGEAPLWSVDRVPKSPEPKEAC
jgi:hypothetical protein